jgi:transcriptional regulator with XRE-family HTH domain
VWVKPQDHQTLGQWLANARKAVGVTQDELAARLQKPQSFISAYERGQRRVDVLELLLILDALRVEPRSAFASIIEETEVVVRRRRSRPRRAGQ